MPDLFEDTVSPDWPAEPTTVGPPDPPPPPPPPPPPSGRPEPMQLEFRRFGEWVRFRWRTMSRSTRMFGIGGVSLGVLALVGGAAGGGGSPTPPAPTPTTVSQLVPAISAPPATLVGEATKRKLDNPLRGLPDLHPAVVAYAGADADRFSNVIKTLQAGGADYCHLWFGVDSLGWRVVPETTGESYPNDRFPIRVFLGYPCPNAVGNPDPQILPTTTTTKAK